jgi:hypothetical protein
MHITAKLTKTLLFCGFLGALLACNNSQLQPAPTTDKNKPMRY